MASLSKKYAEKMISDFVVREADMWGQVVDGNGAPVGEMFMLDMQYDQSRAAFTNLNVPYVMADRTVVVQSVYLYGPDKTTQLAWVDLDQRATLIAGDSISFEKNGINLGFNTDQVTPLLHIIEEEACIEDAF